MSIPIAIRSSSGLKLNLGPPKFGIIDEFQSVSSKSCRIMLFSPDGSYFVYINGQNLHILETKSWNAVNVIENYKPQQLAFSPKGTYLCSWEPFTLTKEDPQGSPNLHIYKTENGQLVKSFVHKKQSNWEPQWSADEKIFSRIVNTDIVFHENFDFDMVSHRFSNQKVASYSLSPTVGNYYLIVHTEGGKGQPSLGRLFKYPNFDNQQSLATKSFFQADKIDFYWNSKGSHVLLMTSTEVDKTGGSYYGKQGLHFISTSGDTAMVVLSKEGPIHAVAWSPNNQEFCVIYGFMPARATLYNLKCNPVYEFGGGPRNSIYYNPHGNILLLGGFGNLRGQIELWDVKSRKIVGKCEAPDSTLLEWSPTGVHFLTATTAPRLRTGNGFKIWHYSGALLFEKRTIQEEELYDVAWQKYLSKTFKEPVLSNAKIESIATNQPQASTQAYRPPCARNKPAVQFKLHDDEEGPHKPGGESVPSKNAQKMKKKRENRKAKESVSDTELKSHGVTVTSNVQVVLTGDPEKDKKIKNIKKKLDAISKLKEQQAQGKTLEINQLSKIKAEDELLDELEQLQL